MAVVLYLFLYCDTIIDIFSFDYKVSFHVFYTESAHWVGNLLHTRVAVGKVLFAPCEGSLIFLHPAP